MMLNADEIFHSLPPCFDAAAEIRCTFAAAHAAAAPAFLPDAFAAAADMPVQKP